MKRLSVVGFILIGLGLAAIAEAASDVGPYYWIFKRTDLRQTSTANPAVAGAPYHFFSLVEIAPGGELMQLSNFAPPGGSVLGLQLYAVNPDGSLEYNSYFSSQAGLDNAFHNGQYTLDLRGRTVNYLPKLTLDPAFTFPATRPKLSNTTFANNQLVIDATAQVTLNWNSFADHDAGGMDVIILTITNGDTTVFREVLPATATSKTFAANFFKKNQSYIADLSFVRVAQRNTATISGSTGLAGYARATRIYVSSSTHTPLDGLANISTRGLVGTGDNVLISGFIITSTDAAPLTVAIRAIGPSLANAGVTGALQDPTVDLFDKDGHLIASSDNWKTTIPDATLIHQIPLDPPDTRESALYRTLNPGRYTAVVRGKNNSTGIALVEVYNIGSDGAARLANISTRGQVLTGDNVLIGGVIVAGPLSHTILLRALGPTIPGVSGVLANPTLQLVNSDGMTLSFNNDWRQHQEAEILATKAQPTDDREAAILQSLGPGRYTAIVASKDANTGVALVEAYALD